MAHTITLIPGDGIGPEVATATRRVLEATGVKIDWEVQEAGAAIAEKRGTTLPEEVLASFRERAIPTIMPRLVSTPRGIGMEVEEAPR